ncbi:Spore germination protein B3 [bioreactor metagenome]|uniref:Spore germination protein B3 n=1 Tax=bioreactor metagenome TaxID=1076179 RepID=A0A644WND7_9ZZZZ
MKTKRFLSLFLLIIFLLPLTGCWDYHDFDDLTLVSAMGFDMEEGTNEITVTVQYYIPGAGNVNGSGGGLSKLPMAGGAVKATGKTIADAILKIQESRRKTLFYGYLNVIVLGENAAKNITKEVIGFADRTPSVRATAYLAVAEGKAEDVLCTADPGIATSVGKNIYELIDCANQSGAAYPVSIEDFAEKVATTGTQPVAPRVTVFITKQLENENPDESKEDEKPVKVISMNEGYQIVDGMAAFMDFKLVGWLNAKESTGLSWITDHKLKIYESVNMEPSSDVDIRNVIIFNIKNSKSKIKVKIEDDKPKITVSTEIEADMRKYYPGGDEKLTSDALSNLEKKLADNVASEIMETIKKSQKDLDSDVCNFGFAFYRKYPKLWHEKYEKDWKDIYSEVPINVEVTAKIQNTGSTIIKFVSR